VCDRNQVANEAVNRNTSGHISDCLFCWVIDAHVSAVDHCVVILHTHRCNACRSD